VFDFLTGVNDHKELTAEDIKGVVEDALIDFHDQQLVDAAQMFAAKCRNNALDIHAPKVVDELTDRNDEGTGILSLLDSILRLPSNPVNDRRVVTIMPAYAVVLPLVVSTRKLLNEADPALKRSREQQIINTLATAQQSLLMAAGAHVLYTYEPGGNPNFAYTSVYEGGLMFDLPLWAYYYYGWPSNSATKSRVRRSGDRATDARKS
jgi:hypothetical protein